MALPSLLADPRRRCGAGLATKRRILSDEATVRRLRLSAKLVGHRGCVNAVSFDASTDSLLTGSDDCMIKLWSLNGHERQR
jgi:WD40 repeat protein